MGKSKKRRSHSTSSSEEGDSEDEREANKGDDISTKKRKKNEGQHVGENDEKNSAPSEQAQGTNEERENTSKIIDDADANSMKNKESSRNMKSTKRKKSTKKRKKRSTSSSEDEEDSDNMSDGSGSCSEDDENDASSSSEDVYSSSDESSEESSSSVSRKKKKKKKKKEPKKKKSKKHRRSHSSSKKKSSKKKDSGSKKKKKKLSKKEKKSSSKEKDGFAAITNKYGSYGILNEEDMFSKRNEFMAWLVEVKGRTLEHCTKWEEKELEASFREDYNTCTMPSKKYYDLDDWEKKMQAKGLTTSKAAGSAVPASFNDEASRMQDINRKREEKRQQEIHKTYASLKSDKEQIDDMKHQEALVAQMKAHDKAGNHAAAAKIRARLNPARR